VAAAGLAGFSSRVVFSFQEDDMEYSVELEKIPSDVKLPQRLENRISFDSQRRRLVFQGFMTKCTYDELTSLTDDVAWHRALEQLFVLTSAEVSGGAATRHLPATALIAAAATVVLALTGAWAAWRHSSAGAPATSTPAVRASAGAR
jgi:hypothetical protein